MSSINSIDDSINQDVTDLLEQLHDHLDDLLTIHWENLCFPIEIGSDYRQGSTSMCLKELRYVFGEKSGERSFMRFRIRVGADDPEVREDATCILELVVRTTAREIRR